MAQNNSQSSSGDVKTGMFNPQVIIAIITLIGTLVVAYFAYRQITDPIKEQIIATQTAEARIATQTAVTNATSLAFAMTLTSVAVKAPPTDTPTSIPPTNTSSPPTATPIATPSPTETLTAIPSATPLPPSPTSTAPPSPTCTSTPTPTPEPVVVDHFEYSDVVELEAVWETNITSASGRTEVEMDATTFVPDIGSSRSLKIKTNIPCVAGVDRYQQIQQYWADGPQDWSSSSILEVWVKGDNTNKPPYGGEVSIILVDGDGEVWQSTRFFPRTSDWTPIKINLIGRGIGNPFDHNRDFVIPTWQTKVVNRILDIDRIQAIQIKSLTTTEWACATASDANGIQYPEFTIWVDRIMRY